MKTAALLALVVVGVGCKAADDYAKKSKMSEARLMLNKLSKYAKTAFVANGQYPIGKAGPTPAVDCCMNRGPHCDEKYRYKVDPAQWQTGVWKDLEFQIDEPHRFRYTYESTDGKSFTATAIGDLDCDNDQITYTSVGVTEMMDGAPVPKVTITDTPTGTE